MKTWRVVASVPRTINRDSTYGMNTARVARPTHSAARRDARGELLQRRLLEDLLVGKRALLTRVAPPRMRPKAPRTFRDV